MEKISKKSEFFGYKKCGIYCKFTELPRIYVAVIINSAWKSADWEVRADFAV